MARQRTLVNLVSKSKVHKKEVPHFCFNAMMKGSKKDMYKLTPKAASCDTRGKWG